ncbi:MAG: orotate phosphoribosyltransferase [FCB group bacterium]|nr:orotate phosphoribosyltransferase [FCB group bacterium]
MTKEDIIEIFKSTGALLEGHFILTSGRHSDTYFQCAKVLQYPQHLTRFGKMISDHFKNETIDVVISPAVGGIVIGTEVGRQLGVKSIFAERKDGKMMLRRGFEINPGDKILVVEDVITTGGSVREVMDVVERSGGAIVGVGVVVDRSGGERKLHSNQYAIMTLSAKSYAENEIPAELKSIPAVKPGSRGLQ